MMIGETKEYNSKGPVCPRVQEGRGGWGGVGGKKGGLTSRRMGVTNNTEDLLSVTQTQGKIPLDPD